MKDRIYQDGEDQQFYYRARGNQVVGPFDTRQHAQKSLDRLTRQWAASPGRKSTWALALQPARIFRRSATRHT